MSMINRIVTFLLLVFCVTPLFAQGADSASSGKLSSLTGTVLDHATQEGIIGATVRLVDTKLGAVTRDGGNFRIKSVPPGTYRVSVSSLGYGKLLMTDVVVATSRPTDIHIELTAIPTGNEDVVVRAEAFQRSADFATSERKFSNEEVRTLPGGFEDVVRAVSILPGVAQAQNGRNDLLVRGGAPSENLYLINNIESPNINHFGTQGSGGGPLSFVNLDFVRDVSFSTGGFGVRYGDKLSSVLSLGLRDGRTDRIGGKATISASQFGLNMEGPISGSGDFLFSARRSYLDLIFRAAGLSFIPEYWDFLGKAHYQLGKSDEITALGIGAIDYVTQLNRSDSDRIKNSQILDNTQDQSLLGVTWKHVESAGYLVTTLGRSTVSYKFNQADPNQNPIFKNTSLEEEYSLRCDATLLPSSTSELTFGAQGKTSRFNADIFLAQQHDPLDLSLQNRYYKSALYAQYADQFLSKVRFSIGSRMDYFSGISQKFWPALRGSLGYSMMEGLDFNVSAGRYYQTPSYIWLVANPVNTDLKEIATDVFVLGVDRVIGSDLKITLEGYYKNYTDYPASLSRNYLVLANTGAGFGGQQDGFASFGLEPLASVGSGRARGIELSVQKKYSEIPIYGTMALSVNDSRFIAKDGIERPSDYDQTFIFNIAGGYKLGDLWEFGLKFRFASGRPYSPIDTLRGDPSFGYQDVTQLNALRLAASHSLDIRIDKRWLFENWTLITYVDVQDIYNHINTNAPVYNTATRQIESQGQIGLLPSVGISAEF